MSSQEIADEMHLQAMSKGACDVTMSSIELLELVNESRVNHGENPVRHNDFIARCKDELDEGDYEIFVIAPPERGGRSFEAIRMTADQCKLVAMRESKGVRRWVLNRLKELEAHPAPALPATYLDALRAHLVSEEKASALASKRHDNVMADCRKLGDFYAEAYSPEKSAQLVKSSTYNDSAGRELVVLLSSFCFESMSPRLGLGGS